MGGWPDIKVRLARDDEAQVVANLVAEIWHVPGMDLEFSRVFPYWLLAEIAGDPVGTINVRHSLPLWSVEMLSIDPLISKRHRGAVARMLTSSAMAMALSDGAQGVVGLIPDDMESYKKVAERREYQEIAHGSLMLGRLR